MTAQPVQETVAGSSPSTFVSDLLNLSLPDHLEVQYRIAGWDVPSRQRWAACRCGWESPRTAGGWHVVDGDVRDHLLDAARAAGVVPSAWPVNGEGYPAATGADADRLVEQLRAAAHHHGWADAMLMEKAAATIEALAAGGGRRG